MGTAAGTAMLVSVAGSMIMRRAGLGEGGVLLNARAGGGDDDEGGSGTSTIGEPASTLLQYVRQLVNYFLNLNHNALMQHTHTHTHGHTCAC